MKRMIWIVMLLGGLWLTVQPVACQAEENLLQDPGFEGSTPNGTFPNSGYWISSHAAGTAGAVATSTAAQTGSVGLWAYTGNESGAYFNQTYQSIDGSPGAAYNAQAYARTPSGYSWVAGSKAVVRIRFIDKNGAILGQHDSNAVTNADSGWQLLSLTTPPAPAGTVKVFFMLYLEKPQGTTGQSIVNYDDTWLSEASACDLDGDGNVNMKDVVAAFIECKDEGGNTKGCIDEAKAFKEECL